ncbi:PREDICTED: putative FBD-associated F-box protein At5g53635 [Camelina sativa]|uniref:FBD-associated F-box protein At5g53635 n=1 Tax=Camelina sativa TaxID=90675 RepID=A0ABM0TP12_CAMSA|nr:PREDICTED: putative FBD-associated F-box protein At5g53635 [Camelina sativa]
MLQLSVGSNIKCHVNDIYRFEIPLSLYMCDTLVSLKLDKVAWASAEFVSFPCLKTMHLRNNTFLNEAAFEALVSCCPVLEELEITGFEDFPNVHRVQSQSLKRLTIRRLLTIEFDYVPELVIDAPLLCGLKIFYLAANIIITNTLESIAKLDINLSFGFEGSDEESVSSKRSNIRNFLSKISRVMDMTISSSHTFKVIHQYSKLEPLPQFGYMSRLCLDLHASELKWLTTTFLESCPNLKSLVLATYESDLRSEDMDQISFSSVPKCLLSSLESVHFEFRYLAEGYAVVFKLGKYFLENSVVLKKLHLHLLYHPRRDDIFQEFLRFPRGSTECEVVASFD